MYLERDVRGRTVFLSCCKNRRIKNFKWQVNSIFFVKWHQSTSSVVTMKRCRWHLKPPPPHFHKVPLHRNKVLVVLFGYALIFSHQNCYSVLCAHDDKSFKQGSTTPETSELQQELWRRTGKELNVFRSVLSLFTNWDRSCSRTVKLRPSKNGIDQNEIGH